MKIRPVRATAESVRRFGSVVSHPTGTPTSQAHDYKFWSDLTSFSIEGETEIGLCTVYRQPTSLIKGMERHLQTPEILIPVDAPFVVPLLLDERPLAEAVAFRVDLGEAIVIGKGVWHAACLPVGKEESSYFVLFRRGTPHQDIQKKPVDPFEVEV
jgi:ureidoglycolate lyase